MTDLRVENHSSIYLVRPETAAGREWLEEHTDGTWFGDALVVEHRYVADLVSGAAEDGLGVS